ncbi:MAG: hypothetical protein JSR46_11795 [Verrucomicrobia bacterium]|nr:hypothetical protein [Verrucomicrobiota bacterium]
MRSVKRMSIVLVLLMGVVLLCFDVGSKSKDKTAHLKPVMCVDFDVSMGKGTTEFEGIFSNPEDIRKYAIVKGLYEANKPSIAKASTIPKIPKIIHQVWIGPKMPPPYFEVFQEHIRSFHPDWQYNLWTDSKLDSLNLGMRDLIDASTNFGEKSDIIRSELLDRFGGVYIDVDIDPILALDELHKKYDFYVGLENPHIVATSQSRVWVGISIIAACPGHPIIKRWKELIRSGWEDAYRNFSSSVEQVVNHTFFPFTRAFFEKCEEGSYVNIAFPPTYFYPFAPGFAAKRRSFLRSCKENVYEFLEDIKVKRPRAFSRIRPETIAVHYWGNSWMPSQPLQLKSLQYQLDLLKSDFYLMQKRLYELEKAGNAQAAVATSSG